jgi:hypothetical protein
MKITVEIASVPDRDNLVAELWAGNEQWGEVSQETDSLQLEIYPKTSNGEHTAWSFSLSEVLEKLLEAEKRLSNQNK